MSTAHPDDCPRPPSGWSKPNKHDIVHFTLYDRIDEPAPEREGWECFFVAVHGANFTTWSYKRKEVTDE